MNYLDFHTHKRNYDDVVCINSPLNFEDYIPQKEFFNIGLHPWRYSNFESLFKSFQKTILKHKENKLFLGTYPLVFVDGKIVGGADELEKYFASL
ncbi:hypothetical protein OAT67_08920 [Bacteriovoracaceae bacterium]|nr:hypothetical protein [Bacteriovoracaceae bacterium]